MTSRANTRIESFFNNAEIVIERLRTSHAELLEYVVIRAGNEDSRLFDADILRELEVLLLSADPGGYLRELVAKVHALVNSLAILLCINEELALTDDSLRTAKARKHLIKIDDLLCRVRCAGLLSVSE